MHISFRRWAVKFDPELERVEKTSKIIDFREGYPKFWHCIFKSRPLPNTWQFLVKFRSVISESSSLKEDIDRIVVYKGRRDYIAYTYTIYTISSYIRRAAISLHAQKRNPL